jgi:hypothetical protein
MTRVSSDGDSTPTSGGTDMRKLALVLAACTGAALLAMVATSLVTGATQEAHEHYKPPADYARDLLAHPAGLRMMFALDVAFLILYTAFFGALTKYLRAFGRPFARVAFGAMVATAMLDILENHHILSLLSLAEHGRPIDDASIAFQEVLSSTKFSVSYLSLVLYGLAIPRTTQLGWLLALFLTVGTLATAILGYAAPPAWRESLDSGRWVGFLAGFTLAFVWLRRARAAPSTAPA